MSGHKLLRLTQRLSNTPQLMEKMAFNSVLSILDSRNDGDFQLRVNTPEDKKNREKSLNYNPDTKVGMIAVDGPLTYLEYFTLCGEDPASYQSIEIQFDQLIEAGAKTIVLSIDSPGGEAYGCFELGSYMRKKADENNVKCIAYVDGLAASAAYGLAASAHEIIANPSSEVGSIGVVVRLRNVNKAMHKMGVEDTYIYAGNSKIPFNEEGEWREDFLDDIQGKVSTLYEGFTQYVADMRGVSVEAVKATEAKTFLADQAVALKLADKTMTREEFFNYLADVVEDDSPMLGKYFGNKEEQKRMAGDVDVTALQAQLADLSVKLEQAEGASAVALSKVAEMSADLEKVSAALLAADEKIAQYKAAEDAAIAAAAQAKAGARKASLSAVLSAEEVEKLASTFDAMDDVAFEAMVGVLKARSSSEQESPLFKEIGMEGEKPVQAASEDAILARMIAEKFGK